MIHGYGIASLECLEHKIILMCSISQTYLMLYLPEETLKVSIAVAPDGSRLLEWED